MTFPYKKERESKIGNINIPLIYQFIYYLCTPYMHTISMHTFLEEFKDPKPLKFVSSVFDALGSVLINGTAPCSFARFFFFFFWLFFAIPLKKIKGFLGDGVFVANFNRASVNAPPLCLCFSQTQRDLLLGRTTTPALGSEIPGASRAVPRTGCTERRD